MGGCVCVGVCVLDFCGDEKTELEQSSVGGPIKAKTAKEFAPDFGVLLKVQIDVLSHTLRRDLTESLEHV